MATPTVPAPAAKPSGSAETQSSRSHDDGRVRRRPPGAAAGERSEPELRARFSRARRPQGAAQGDGGREARHPDRHRRPRNPHRQDGAGGDAPRSPARPRRLPPGGARARAAGDRRGGRGPARMGQLAVGRTRSGAAAGGGAARDIMAPDLNAATMLGQSKTAFQAEIDAASRDDRFLAVQHRLCAGALFRTADQRRRRVEPDGVSPARGLRLRRVAVQLHRDWRQPDDRAGADGQHGDLEAGVDRRC